MIRGLAVLVLAMGIVVACGQAMPRDPSAIPGSALVLTFDGRGNPPVILRFNGVAVVHLACMQGETRTFAPGAGGVPALPWDLQVVRERDGQVLLSERVTSMPKFLLAFPDSVALGSLPALGPIPPTCAPA